MSVFGVVVLPNASMALKTEKALQNAGLPVKAVPTPREFSNDCGIAIRFEWDDEAQVREALAVGTVEFAGIYRMRQA